MEYTNDIFLDMMANPGTLNLADYKALGYTPESTRLLSEDEYKRSSRVRENPLFQNENGDFDERTFHQFYENVKIAKDLFSRDQYSQNLVDYTSYDKQNIFAPQDKAVRNNTDPNFGGPILTKLANPARVTRGFIGVGLSSDPVKSMDEIAQGQKVLANPTEAYNPDGTINQEKAIWHDAPEESFFTDFWDTRVLAQFDEDGTHFDPIEGRMVEHKKGDLRLNENGTYYYENLDGRDIYGRRVLNKLNTLTKEDSALNTYDFFDSDDIEQKSLPGVIMRNLALVGSMFLPYGVGLGIASLSAATNISGMLAVLGKMLSGSDSATLSAIEGWSQSWNRQFGKTQYATEHTWNLENFIDIFTDLIGQLREQRALFELVPGIIKGGPAIVDEPGLRGKYGVKALEEKIVQKHADLDEVPLEGLVGRLRKELGTRETEALGKVLSQSPKYNALIAQRELENYLKSYNKIGAALSKTYMAGLISQHLYGEAKNQGLSDTEATLVTFGRFLAEEALLNTPLGDFIFPELRYEGLKYKKIMDGFYNEIKENYRTLIQQAKTPAAKNNAVLNILQKAFDKHRLVQAERLVQKDGTLRNSIKTAFVMGAEAGTVNDIEEALNDLAKASYNTLSWLGTGHTMKHDENYFDRYAMGMLSGLVGGGITSAVQSFSQIRDLSNIPDNAMEQFVYLYRNGEMPKFLKSVDNTTFEDPNLGFIPTIDVETGEISFENPSENNPSWDSAIKQIMHRQAQLIEDLVEEEHAGIEDREFIDRQLQKDARLQFLSHSNVSKRYLNYFNNLVSKIVRIKGEIRAGEAQQEVNDTNRAAYEKANKDRIKNNTQKVQELQKLQQELKDLLDGKMSGKFISEALFEMSPLINSLVIPELTTVKGFAKATEGVDYDKLKDEEKKKWNERFKEFNENPFKSDVMIHIADQFTQFNQKFGQHLLISRDQYKALASNRAYKEAVSILNNIYSKIHNSQVYDPSLDLANLTTQQMNGISQWLTDSIPMLLLLSNTSDVVDPNTKEPILNQDGTRVGNNDQLREGYEQAINLYRKDQQALGLAQEAQNRAAVVRQEAIDKAAKDPTPENKAAENAAKLEYTNATNEVGRLNQIAAKSFNDLRAYFTYQIFDKMGALLEPLIDAPYINPEVKDAVKSIITQMEEGWREISQIKTENIREAIDTVKRVRRAAAIDVKNNFLDRMYSDVPEDVALQNDMNAFEQIFGWTPQQAALYLRELGTVQSEYSLDNIKSVADQALKSLRARKRFEDAKQGLLQSLNTKTNTDIIQFLRNYTLDLTNNRNLGDIFDIVQKVWRENLKNLADVAEEDNLLEYIPEVKRILRLVKASVLAARTDETSFLDLFGGYNAATNEFNKTTENWEDLPVIESYVADAIEDDINLIYNKVRAVEDLINANAGRKLDTQNRVQSNYQFIIYNRLNSLLNNDAFVKSMHLEKVKDALKSMDLHSKYSTLEPGTRMQRTEQERQTLNEEHQQISRAIYEWAHDPDTGQKVLNNEAELIKAFEDSGIDFLTDYQAVLTLDAPDIDDISFFNEFVARMSLDYGVFQKTVSNLNLSEYCPLPPQEQAVFMQVAVTANRSMFEKMLNVQRQVVKRQWKKTDSLTRAKILPDANDAKLRDPKFDDYCLMFLPTPQHASIVQVEGGAGVGKSTGTLSLLGKILNEVYKDALKNPFIVHNTKGGAEANAQAFGVPKAQVFTHEEFMKKIDPNRTLEPDGSRKLNEADYGLDADGNFVSKVPFNQFAAEDKPTAIVIDEVSQISSFDLDTIGRMADQLNIPVYTIGDFKQSGVSATAKIPYLNQQKVDFGLDCLIRPNQIIHGMKLGISMRTDNEQQNANNQEFTNMFIDPINHTEITLRYYQDAETFNGTKVYDQTWASGGQRIYDKETIDAIIKDLEALVPIAQAYAAEKKRPELAKIGFIFDDTTKDSELRKQIAANALLKDSIQEYPNSSALGRESVFFVVDINPTSEEFDRNLYTGITRAIKGTILLTPKDRTKLDKTNIKLIKQEGPDPTTRPDKYTELSKKKFTDSHIAELKRLTKDITGTINIETVKPAQESKKGPQEVGVVIPDDAFDRVIKDITDTQVRYILDPHITLNEESAKIHLGIENTKVPVYAIIQRIENNALVNELSVETDNGKLIKIVSKNTIEEFTNGKVKAPALAKPEETELQKLFDFENEPPVASDDAVLDPKEVRVKSDAELKTAEQVLEQELKNAESTEETIVVKNSQNTFEPINTDQNVKEDVSIVGGVEFPALGNIFYSFNNFLLGLTLKPDGTVDSLGQYNDVRIDGVNGLLKILRSGGVLKDRNSSFLNIDPNSQDLNQHIQDFEYILGQVWRTAIAAPDKQKLVKQLTSLFTRTIRNPALQNPYVTFGLQVLPDFDNASVQNSFAKAQNPLVRKLFRQTSESRVHNLSENTGIPRLQLVMIYGADVKGVTQDLLSIPLYSINSPASVLQTRNPDGSFVYDAYWKSFSNAYQNSKSIGQSLIALLNDPSLKNNAPGLYNLINIWLGYSYGVQNSLQQSHADIFFIHDDKWVPSTGLNDRGPQITSRKGNLQLNGAFQYNAAPITLDELFSNPRLMRSNIFALRNNSYLSGHTLHEIASHASGIMSSGTGHPFIIVTSNQTDTPFKDFVEEATSTGSSKKTFMLGWVLPPTENIMNYMQNVHNILYPTGAKVFKNLGDILTPFEIGLQVLRNYKYTNNAGQTLSVLEVLQQAGHVLPDVYNTINEALSKYAQLRDTFKNSTNSVDRIANWNNLRKFLISETTKWTRFDSVDRSRNNLMLTFLNRILHPIWAEGVADNIKNNYQTFIEDAFKSYTKPIYYRLTRANGQSSNLLLLNPDPANPNRSAYTMDTMQGQKPIQVAMKIDTSVAVGNIQYTDSNNNQVDFFDYVVKEMAKRNKSGNGWRDSMSSDGQAFVYGNSKLGAQVQSPVQNLVNRLAQKGINVTGNTIQEVVSNLNAQNSLIKGVVIQDGVHSRPYLFDIGQILATPTFANEKYLGIIQEVDDATKQQFVTILLGNDQTREINHILRTDAANFAKCNECTQFEIIKIDPQQNQPIAVEDPFTQTTSELIKAIKNNQNVDVNKTLLIGEIKAHSQLFVDEQLNDLIAAINDNDMRTVRTLLKELWEDQTLNPCYKLNITNIQ